MELRVSLRRQELERLFRLARDERRKPEDQASVLLRDALSARDKVAAAVEQHPAVAA